MTCGVVYYNFGLKMLVRLSISLYTCKQYYNGSITVICDENSFYECKKITDYFKVDIIKVENVLSGKNIPFLNKCSIHKFSPYDISIFLDSDTIILSNIDKLFNLCKKYDFVVSQFSNWGINKRIKKRINNWKLIFPELIKPALNFGKAINTGIFSFKKNSELMHHWLDYAIKGQNTFIPDETSCQLIIHKYKHKIINNDYNTSCKYDKITSKTKIVHFHGRKHCRIENGSYLFNSKLWYNEFDKLSNLNIIKNNIQFDKMLVKNLRSR